MIKTSVEKLANGIGFDIGMSDDQTQGDLLNGFCEALSNSMQKRDLDMQLSYLADKLAPKSEKIILNLAEFIKLKQAE